MGFEYSRILIIGIGYIAIFFMFYKGQFGALLGASQGIKLNPIGHSSKRRITKA
jgi:hypothetical protein